MWPWQILTHGCYTYKRRGHACVEPFDETVPCNTLPQNVHSSGVDAPLGSLHSHLDQIEWVSHYDSEYTAYTTSHQRTKGLDRGARSLLHIFLELLLGRQLVSYLLDCVRHGARGSLWEAEYVELRAEWRYSSSKKPHKVKVKVRAGRRQGLCEKNKTKPSVRWKKVKVC
jgi:hypothetical protein